MKRNKRTVLPAALLLLGTVLLLWRPVHGHVRDKQVAGQVEVWKEAQENRVQGLAGLRDGTKALYPELREAMEAYNREIFADRQDRLVDAESYQRQVFDLAAYGLEDCVVGLISIPSIGVEMPLRLGATGENLALGWAQLTETSMPVGGEDTNCVVAAHRGWDSGKYFRDAEKVQVGDTVILENLWETLTYEVVEIQVIEPDEVDAIFIQPGRELLTLFTCTPYGLPTHRLLIICERVSPEA